MIKRIMGYAAGLILAMCFAASPAFTQSCDWDLTSGILYLPTESCSPWELFAVSLYPNGSPLDYSPEFDNTEECLVINTDETPAGTDRPYKDFLVYQQLLEDIPNPWVIEFEVKIVSHNSNDDCIACLQSPFYVEFQINKDWYQNMLVLNENQVKIRINAETLVCESNPSEITIDNTNSFVEYRISVDTITKKFDVDFRTPPEVEWKNIFDDKDLLAVTNDSNLPTQPFLWWGDGSGCSRGESRWKYFRHNGYSGLLTVDNSNDDGPGSLRHAINCANSCPGPNTIIFDVPGPIVITPAVGNPLPALTDITGGTTISGKVNGNPRSVSLDGINIFTEPGLLIESNYNVVQDVVINHFWDCIRIEGNNNSVTGCYIGVDAAGETRLPHGSGIDILGNHNVIGGVSPLDRNVIAGDSNYYAIRILGSTDSIMGNYINIKATGDALLNDPNPGYSLFSGIWIGGGTDNWIGTRTPGSGNVISGCYSPAIGILSDHNFVFRNQIGLDAGGLNVLGNFGQGIEIWGDYNLIGDETGEENKVSGSWLEGIRVEGAVGNEIRANTVANSGETGISVAGDIFSEARLNTLSKNIIYANGGLGINLGDDGVTGNDPGDVDDGPNDLLNFPEITSAQVEGVNIHIIGNAPPNAHIEYFEAAEDGSPIVPGGEHGEASRYLGSADAASDGAIDHFIDPGPSGIPVKITATATDLLGNTSEFSKNVMVGTSLSATGYSPISMMISDPDGLQFGLDADGNLIDEIPGAEYHTEPHDSIYIPSMKIGLYTISYVRDIGDPDPSTTYSSALKIAGLPQLMVTVDKEVPEPGVEDIFTYVYETGYHYPNGDGNRDGYINIADVVFVVNYFYYGGDPPDPFFAGDANCDLIVNIDDAVKVINYIFKGGEAPCYFEP